MKIKDCTEAELPQEGILFALNFLPWKFLLIKKLAFKKFKITYKSGLGFFDFQLFYYLTKIPREGNWVWFSCSNSGLPWQQHRYIKIRILFQKLFSPFCNKIIRIFCFFYYQDLRHLTHNTKILIRVKNVAIIIKLKIPDRSITSKGIM